MTLPPHFMIDKKVFSRRVLTHCVATRRENCELTLRTHAKLRFVLSAKSARPRADVRETKVWAKSREAEGLRGRIRVARGGRWEVGGGRRCEWAI